MKPEIYSEDRPRLGEVALWVVVGLIDRSSLQRRAPFHVVSCSGDRGILQRAYASK
jgi:hypothetical protein